MEYPIDETQHLLTSKIQVDRNPTAIARRWGFVSAIAISGTALAAVLLLNGKSLTLASPLADNNAIQGASDHSFAAKPGLGLLHSVKQNEDFSLSIDVHVQPTGAGEGGYYTVSWEPEGAPELKLWTVWKPIKEGHLYTQLFRVRSMHNYVVNLWTVSHPATEMPILSDSTRYYSGSSGIWQFDDGPVGIVHGTPGWDLVLTDHAVGKYPHSGYMVTNFTGPIALDTAGFVVWYYNRNDMAQVTTQMVSSNHILLIDNSDNALLKVSPSGEVVANHTFDCNDDSIYGYHGIQHEIREDSHNHGTILTLEQKLVRYGGMVYPQLVDGIGEWKPDMDGIKSYHVKYWLNDYFDVKTARSKYSNAVISASCTDGKTFEVQDWSHANSVDATEESYIVSIRSLSAVAAFAKDGYGHGMQWLLTSNDELDSNFTFIPPEGRFFNQHDATVVGYNGNKMVISMMDNGDLRPGCDASVPSGNCWSRGVEYELDFEKWTCTLIWEYRPASGWHNDEYLFSKAKGSTAKISNSSRMVAFSAIIWPDETPKQEYDNSSFVIYEIDHIRAEKPNMRSMMTVTSDLESFVYPYRAVPLTHISGETSTMPTDVDVTY
mmetsp:Transcript_9200/g.11821  ORF Transcript_9200/g.11821 Transcript_9200/m.11821 type:complete len:604 (-) Transcript_9200:42-1853(-)|eukprot:CAMPEP_0185753000 /NCGR_PEP_ID=MMETSP1174-20130828/11762_1 /TAXON_ID=35687 /ORGANISM="Dictyocha speculum, Strain CCMP1381" /LENGTH=603 /DNA_ID=CAMNT_0028430677 /DNA_START=111 /DNA_END=1922 /DNA_ORIENTATION=-